MRVILTTNFSPWSAYSGGGQRSTHNLAKALSRRGHDVAVVFTKPPWERLAVPDDLPYTVHWATLPSLRSRRDAFLRPLSAFTVARAVRSLLQPGSIVHANGEEAALLPRLRRRDSFPFVLTPRYPNYPAPLLAPAPPSLLSPRLLFSHFKFVQLGMAVRGADLCCPTSRSAACMIQQTYKISERRMCVVPNGVSAVYLQIDRATDASSGPILFFGRLARSKGVDVLLAALALLGETAPPCLIIGRGEAAPALSRQIHYLALRSRVRMLDWKAPAELATLLTRASMVVLPSREESFGNAIAEAMATGTPIISTRTGSIPELITHGKTGLLVPPDAPQALAEAITHLVRHPVFAEQLGRSAQQHIKAHYSWEAVATQFESIYASLLSTQPGGVWP